MKIAKLLVLFVSVSLLLISCTGEIPTTESKKWLDYTFRVESRPPHITQGMNELLLIGNYQERNRAFDLIVSFRIGPTGKWSQAIQDGHTGVYRRAMKVTDPNTDVLYVHIKRKGKTEETMFEFPLNYSSAGSPKAGL